MGQFAPPEQQEARLRAMTDRLAHRGPDGSNVWSTAEAGLGHRRLAIIDLKTGDQPMWDVRHEQVIVYNGEIYNYRELKAELTGRGYTFCTASDTEIIPAVLEEWGLADGLRRLRGMFAFAIFNTRTRQLTLARDRCGIKPLYWTRKNGTVLFASEPKALLLPGLADRRMDSVSIHDYLALGYSLAPRTCWAGIQALPAASWLQLDMDGNQRQGTYWEWTPRPDYAVHEGEWLERLEATLTDSLRQHLLSDVPLGAFLSGGIDSSLAVALLVRNGVQSLQTFNVAFTEQEYDEAPFAQQVADLYATEHHKITIASEQADPEALAQAMEQFDEPFGDSASLPNYLLSQATAKHVKVVLSGDGGDEVLGGYPLYRRQQVIETLSGFQWADPLVRPSLHALEQVGFPSARQAANAWYHAQGDPVERLLRAITIFPAEEQSRSYIGSFREQALSAGPTTERVSKHMPSSIPEPVDRFLAFEMRMRLQCGYLRKVDITSSAHGLETRVPYLDNRMLELAEVLPSRFKVHGSQLKYLAYRLAARYLPEPVVHRQKHGFNFPFEQWSRRAPVMSFLEGLIRSPQAAWRGLLKPDLAERAWSVFSQQQSEPELSRPLAARQIYRLAALELWLQKWQPTI